MSNESSKVPKPSGSDPSQHFDDEPTTEPLDADTVVADAIEFFGDDPDVGSPASDSDAPAPG